VARKRYRYRLRRLSPVVGLVVLAGLGGAWVGSREHPAPTATIAAAQGPVGGLGPAVTKVVRTERLLSDDSLLSHGFAPALLARSAILVDASSGRVLWQLHAHQRRQVASTTKIMTALLALRKLGPHDIVTVDRTVPRVPLVREGLRAGEKVEAWKLFYAMLLYSGNDDALALAIAAGGTKWHFVHQMNAEARRLGLRDTHFVSPSGVVDVGNYSSAWDLAALTRVAMRSARFRGIVKTHVKHVAWTAPTFAKIYVNNNRLLASYRGANGVKTGYTHESGWCLVATATRHGHKLIAVVLDSPNIYGDARTLLNLGFSHT
jgi:serine-type D-Ala-D-Ala carboxypeptidase (penicillin-binding protein 5/6)